MECGSPAQKLKESLVPGKKRALIFLSGHFYKLEDKLRMEMFKLGRGGDGTRGSATGRNNGACVPEN